jgi:cellulose synthase/poly-beta-1,6-N-acetylglucosamine synthase-like glycosyltransferase
LRPAVAPLLSVVVPVHGRLPALRQCLAALRVAATPATEIIVVDDASPQDAGTVGRADGARVLRLDRNRGPAAARNVGAHHARGSILLFVDADVVVAPDTLRRVVSAFQARPEMAALFGSYDTSPRAPNLVSQYRNLLHHFLHQRGSPDASTFWAGCGAVRRKAFEQVGGFDETRYRHPSIEDIELGGRLRATGFRIVLDPTLQVTHLKQWTLVSMVATDVARRAIPWARLLLERGRAPNDLNLGHAQRVSAVLAVVAIMAAAAALQWPALLGAAGLATGAVVVLNRNFFGFLRRQRRLAFATACVPLHLLYYASAVAGYGAAWLAPRLPGRRRRRPPPIDVRTEFG